MQIVIDIPDNEYTLVKNREDFYVDRDNIVSYVRNGKPLPKGHGRLIVEPTEEDIAKTVGGQNDFADCIREAVKTVFANASSIIEADEEVENGTDR